MLSTGGNTLARTERVKGKVAVSTLMSGGRWGKCEFIRYCFVPTNGLDHSRIMVSVPKKLFKRAVKRNLLKRRVRESFRTQKDLLDGRSVDILFVYNSPEVLDSSVIKERIADVLREIASRVNVA